MHELREWVGRISDAFLVASRAQRIAAAMVAIPGGAYGWIEAHVLVGIFGGGVAWATLQTLLGIWRPTFELSTAPGRNGWVRLLLRNNAVAGEYWVDVIDVDGAASAPVNEWAVRWVGGTKRYRLVRGEAHELEIGQAQAPASDGATLEGLMRGHLPPYRLIVPTPHGHTHEIDLRRSTTTDSITEPVVLALEIGKDTGQRLQRHRLEVQITDNQEVSYSVRPHSGVPKQG